MTTIISPVAVWSESPLSSASVPLQRVYFVQDPITGEYSLSTSPNNEAARLADLTGTGAFGLQPLTAIGPTTPVKRITIINGGDAIFY